MELRNCMEALVLENLETVLKVSGCCSCNRCRMDMAAIALNQLPAQYVVTQKGEIFTKAKDMEPQYHANILTAIAKAVSIVSRKPNHDQTE